MSTTLVPVSCPDIPISPDTEVEFNVRYTINQWDSTAAEILAVLTKLAIADTDKKMMDWLTEKGADSHA